MNGMRVARSAMVFPDADARWQVAEFLGTQECDEARDLLRRLLLDAEEYVRRRALLALPRIDSAFAVGTAIAWLSRTEEYSRLAALSVLHDAGAPELQAALSRLADDPSALVRGRVAEIRRAMR